MAIPKIIHYCWISSDPWDEKTTKCFNSWKKHIPDYEFKLWNLETLPKEVVEAPTVKNALKNKKWAFVADYVRIWAIYNYGGIYMDLDVELLKSPNLLLSNNAFLGLEKNNIGAHIMGSIPKHPYWKFMLEHLYNKNNFCPLPNFITELFIEYYKEIPTANKISDIQIYPNSYFNPYTWDNINKSGDLKISDSTYCIHWYSGSWIPKYKYSWWYKIIYLMADKLHVIKLLRKIRGY